MERRKEPRLAIDIPIAFYGPTHASMGAVTDLSMSGVRVVSSLPVPSGTPLTLSVCLPDDNDKPVEIELATVRWSQDGEFGLSTVLLGEESRDRLRRFLGTNFQMEAVVLQTRSESNGQLFHNGNAHPSAPGEAASPCSSDHEDGASPAESQGDGAERRQLKRLHVGFPIRLVGDLTDRKGVVVDLSLGGCGITADEGLKDAKYLGLVLSPPGSDAPLKVEVAAVRWVGEQQAGLEFIRMTTDQKKRLSQLMKHLEMVPGIHRD